MYAKSVQNESSAAVASAVQPHMALAYDIPADLKLFVSQSHAKFEEVIIYIYIVC